MDGDILIDVIRLKTHSLNGKEEIFCINSRRPGHAS